MNCALKIKPQKFQKLILHWFDQFGRKHLPWQQNKTPYRVWVSEIMLQQTQVSTVIAYFERFMQQFPDIESLANAKEDEVLHLWTGLGYYNRARNLHKTANIIHHHFSGKFPSTLEDLEALPGIGRSTAGAILSIAFQHPATILDGNVKRVLVRLSGTTQWPGEQKTIDLLWQMAEKYTPTQRNADYSQAMMDLGATICIRGKPLCTQCPLKKECSAHAQGIEKELPLSKPKKSIPVREATLLFICNKKRVLLDKRPSTGVWQGLWSPPELNHHASIKEIKSYCQKHLSIAASDLELNEVFRHTFSHFHLDILPVIIHAQTSPRKVMDSEQRIWYNLQNSPAVGLPAPVKKILRTLT